jgi:hypothetical protein
MKGTTDSSFETLIRLKLMNREFHKRDFIPWHTEQRWRRNEARLPQRLDSKIQLSYQREHDRTSASKRRECCHFVAYPPIVICDDELKEILDAKVAAPGFAVADPLIVSNGLWVQLNVKHPALHPKKPGRRSKRISLGHRSGC